jgi:fumarate reductase flavoprotein subunit
MAEADFDLIVIGGGGASVMVLEADKKLGGATLAAGGVFHAAGTSGHRTSRIRPMPCSST